MMFGYGDKVLVKGDVVAVVEDGIKVSFTDDENNLHTLWFKENSLMLDMTNPLEETMKSAYEQGLNEGRKEAWELARTLYDNKCDELGKIFGIWDSFYEIIRNCTPQEALAKLKAYEEAQTKIEVGDVVTIFPRAGGEYNAIIVRISSNNYINVFYGDGIVASDIPPELYKKTGKHIDISSILEQIGE